MFKTIGQRNQQVESMHRAYLQHIHLAVIMLHVCSLVDCQLCACTCICIETGVSKSSVTFLFVEFVNCPRNSCGGVT